MLVDEPGVKFPWVLCPVLKGDHQRLGTLNVQNVQSLQHLQ